MDESTEVYIIMLPVPGNISEQTLFSTDKRLFGQRIVFYYYFLSLFAFINFLFFVLFLVLLA